MYIYVITNKCNGKQYVGQTKRKVANGRINAHFQSPEKSDKPLHRAIVKYGRANFCIEVIPYLGASSKALDAIEKWQIAKRNTLVPNGYNLTDGGDGGGIPGKVARANLSKAMKGRIFTNEHKANLSRAQRGRKLSKEHCSKISEGQKGRPAWNKGKPGTFLGRKHTNKSKQKMSKAKKKPWSRTTSEQDKNILKYYNKGLSIRKVSKVLNINMNDVYQVLRRSNSTRTFLEAQQNKKENCYYETD